MSDESFEYVYVTEEGNARELGILEKIYLRTEYHGNDGDRPYIKSHFEDLDGRGSRSGFCLRSALPREVVVQSTLEYTTDDQAFDELKRIKLAGYRVNTHGILRI